MSVSISPLSTSDLEIRRLVYDGFIERSTCPSRGEVAQGVGVSETEVVDSFRRLAEAHVLVLQPGSGEVLMANPFSAVPTAFRVEADERGWWANCIWDGLGVVAMIGKNAVIHTSCADCGEAIVLEVKGLSLGQVDALVHFAVPAAHWWEDIVFT